MPLKLTVKMAERNKGGATQPAALTELRMHSLCSFSWWEKYLAVRVLCWDNFLAAEDPKLSDRSEAL